MLWRVVITDSDMLDGVAPVCPHQMRPGGLHHRAVPTRGLRALFAREKWYDPHGVYDCCPHPFLWAPDTYTAAELADMMSACGIQTGSTP